MLEEEPTVALFRPLCDVLSDCAHRWRSLNISGPLNLVSLFYAKSEGRSILNSLFMTPEAMDHEIRSSGHFDLGCMVPAPNFIFTIGMPLKSVKIHWGDVTMLTMHSLHIDECVELFRQSTKLHTCNFSYIQPALVDTPIPEERFWLPNLKVLILFNLSRHRSESARLLDYITAPSLGSLSAAAESEVDMINLLSFLARSSPPLKALSFWSSPTEEALIGMLRRLPTLQSLSTYNINISSVFFDLLASTTDLLSEPQFLPHLISLRLNISTPITFSWTSVAGIFGERTHEIGLDPSGYRRRPLSKLKMRVGDEEDEAIANIIIDENIVRLFLAYREAGISVDIMSLDDEVDFVRI